MQRIESGADAARGLRLPARAGGWYVITGAVGRGIGFLSTLIFTRLLTAEEYGLFSLYTSWLAILSAFCTLEIGGGTISRGLQEYRERKGEYLSCVMLLVACVSGACALIYFLFFDFFSGITGLGALESLLLFLGCIFGAVITVFTAGERNEYRYRSVALFNLGTAILMPIVSILFIRFTPFHGEARIFGQVISLGVFCLPIIYIMLKRGVAHPRLKTTGYILGTALPLMPHYFAVSLTGRIVEIGVSRSAGQAALGKFSVAMSLGFALTILTNGISGAIYPWIMRKLRSGERDAVWRFLSLSVSFIAPVCLLFLAFIPEMMAILAPREYTAASPCVYPITLSVILSFISGCFGTGEMYFNQKRKKLSGIFAAAVAAAGSFLILPRLPFTAAGVILLVSHLVLLSGNLIAYKRASGEAPESLSRLGATLGFTVIYALLLYWLRSVLISRIILTIPLIMLLLPSGFGIYKAVREPKGA